MVGFGSLTGSLTGERALTNAENDAGTGEVVGIGGVTDEGCLTELLIIRLPEFLAETSARGVFDESGDDAMITSAKFEFKFSTVKCECVYYLRG